MHFYCTLLQLCAGVWCRIQLGNGLSNTMGTIQEEGGVGEAREEAAPQEAGRGVEDDPQAKDPAPEQEERKEEETQQELKEGEDAQGSGGSRD